MIAKNKMPLLIVAAAMIYFPMTASAYVDPSVMSYTVQAIAGVAIAFGVIFGVVWRRVKKGAKKALNIDENAGKEVEEELSVNEDNKTK